MSAYFKSGGFVLSVLAIVGAVLALCYSIATSRLNTDQIRESVAEKTHFQVTQIFALGLATQSSGGALFECTGDVPVPEGWFKLPERIPDSDVETQHSVFLRKARNLCGEADSSIDWNGRIEMYCPSDGDSMVFMRIGCRSFVLWNSLK